MVSVIDLSAFWATEDEQKKDLVRRWNQAMQDEGFAIVVNHGVPAQKIDDMFARSRKFFLKTPKEEKMKFNFGPYGTPQGGFTPIGVEGVQRSLGNGEEGAPADLVESYVFNFLARENAQKHAPILAGAAVEFTEAATEVMHLLHQLSARALELDDENFFDGFHNPPNVSTRLAFYPAFDNLPLKKPTMTTEKSFRYGAHKDYTGFTLLFLEPSTSMEPSGLQVFVHGDWKDVICPPYSIIVNIGDLWQHWTSKKWKSTLHRVLKPDPGSPGAKIPRFSIPVFTGPNDAAMIRPIESIDDSETVNAGDYLQGKLKVTNV